MVVVRPGLTCNSSAELGGFAALQDLADGETRWLDGD